MKEYGHFCDESREFVITDAATPWPWINYLGTEDFFSLVSGTAGGYCFCRDAKFRRILRYRYNGVPMDDGGRYFYIKDGEQVWNPGWKPCKTPLDSYECRHGMGYTRIISSKDGVAADLTMFVPVGKRCEVHSLTITNNSAECKSLKLFSFLEWCLWNAQTDGENFQRNLSTGEVEIDGSAIYHKTEYRERRNHYAFYSVNCPIQGFDTDREAFIGMYNGFSQPEAVLAGRPCNSVAHGWSPIASHFLELELAPGQSRNFIFVLGYVENPSDEKFTNSAGEINSGSGTINKARAKELISSLDTLPKVEAELDKLKAYWDDILGRFQIKSEVPQLDRMVNIWNQYQCMVTFNMSRSASYFESGIGRGMGFRDSNQDLVGFVHQIPSRARERILDIAATQFADGGCYHQYQPLSKRGNNDIGGGFGDDPLWLVFGTTAYLRETADFSILDEPVPFDNVPGTEKTLLEHLLISFNKVVSSLGPHGLPLIGRADWNDCLNLNCFSFDPDESFQTTENKTEGSKAESLMIAGQTVFCGRQLAELLVYLGKTELASRVQEEVEKMVESVEEYGWDGEWFLRAYDYYGNKIGSRECEEGKIFIESQGWCAMAGIGSEKGMCDKALDSVKKMMDTRFGIVINNPAYTRYFPEYGEISSYPQGYKENAGIFCHNNPWIVIAEAVAGRAGDAWAHYCKTSPAFIEDQKLHKVEPYVYCQMVAGKDAFRPGEGKNSWLTGTAAWSWHAASEWLLGIKPAYGGLLIEPCIPLKHYTVHRVFRDAVYDLDITIDGSSNGKYFIPYEPGHHKMSIKI